MMFPRGPRFVPEKVSDVPGPNSYNVVQDSQFEAYKRGALYEQADRFPKEKVSDVPGPGTYNPADPKTMKPSKNATTQPNNERLVILQRKLDDLERLHADNKISYQSDLERLRIELVRTQKMNAEQAEHIEKLKKRNDAFDERIAEYKKGSAADHAEIKDLRVKLRMAQHELAQMVEKQEKSSETRKALYGLETKRKEELKDRDKKISALERNLSAETKELEATRAKLKEVQEKAEDEVKKNHQAAQTKIDHAQEDAQKAWLMAKEGGGREARLLEQLEQYKTNMARVAEEYGRLANTSVARTIHDSLRNEHIALQLGAMRLERKLANSEEQVVELAHLIRQTSEKNTELEECVRSLELECAFYSHSLAKDEFCQRIDEQLDRELNSRLDAVRQGVLDFHRQKQDARILTSESMVKLYRGACDQMLLQCALRDKMFAEGEQLRHYRAAELSQAIAERDAFKSELTDATQKLGETSTLLSDMERCLMESTKAQGMLKQTAEELKVRMQQEVSRGKETSQKDHAIIQKLNGQIVMNRATEESLQVELQQMYVELADASKFQDAYYELADEVGALLARNALAEEEATRLSKFNAEILGHHNPAQRIMYVDRIRRELAETKQKLLISGRERDAVITDNEDLKNELAMYKSVMMAVDDKPRSNITRITRPPLTNQSNNLTTSTMKASSVHSDMRLGKSAGLEPIPGEMTLDEIS